jgi:hypothetical protein
MACTIFDIDGSTYTGSPVATSAGAASGQKGADPALRTAERHPREAGPLGRDNVTRTENGRFG